MLIINYCVKCCAWKERLFVNVCVVCDLQLIALAVSFNELNEIFERSGSSVLGQLGAIAVDEDGRESVDILFGAQILVVGESAIDLCDLH